MLYELRGLTLHFLFFRSEVGIDTVDLPSHAIDFTYLTNYTLGYILVKRLLKLQTFSFR